MKPSPMEQSLIDDPTCYRCQKVLPPPFDGEKFPAQRRGCLSISLNGGYGMFHDRVNLGCVIDVYLCHDCSTELFRFLKFDPITISDMRGLHPYDKQGEPCCEYGWTGTSTFGNNDGSSTVEFGFQTEDPIDQSNEHKGSE